MLEKVLEHSLQKLHKGADFDGKITKIENGHALFRAIFFYEFKLDRSAREAHQQLGSLRWEALPHPPYWPDIAPSDYHLFRALKN